MVVNGFDLIDFGQQLGIGGLRAHRHGEKKADKRDSGSHEHGRMSLGACARRVNLNRRECKIRRF
jgi:hypothetical protein